MIQDGFGIDKKGKAFYRVQHSVHTRKVFVKCPEGTEEKFIKGVCTYTDETPEQRGWQKEVVYEDIILLMLPNPKKHFRASPTLWHRKYSIKASDYMKYNPCGTCIENNVGSRYHYLRAMVCGQVFHICWIRATKLGRSATTIKTMENVLEGELSPYVKLLSEEKVSKRKARQILKQLNRTPSIKVRFYLSNKYTMIS